MDASSLRLQRHLIGASIVVLVLSVFQYWQGAIDWGFIFAVAILYFIVRIVLDYVTSDAGDRSI
ncbi:hypothetical protein [Halostagnicola bangensis]